MSRVSVAEAARLLDVHVQRVHQLIASGALPAERVGRQWAVEKADLKRFDRRAAGRPLSARSAWDLVLVAAEQEDPGRGGQVSEVSPPRRSRARSRLAALVAQDEDVAPDPESRAASLASSLRALLRGRADRRLYVASRRDLEDLRADPRLILAGASLPASHLASADVVEAYVDRDEVDGLVREYLLVDGVAVDANVVLHVFDGAEVRLRGFDMSTWLLLAADLAEHQRPREEAQAVEIIRAARAREKRR